MITVHQRTCLFTHTPALNPLLKKRFTTPNSKYGEGECLACAVTHVYVSGDVNYGLFAQAAVGPTLPPKSREEH
jgi:hypothetical protein